MDREQLNWLQYERRRNPAPPLVVLPEKYRAATLREIPPGVVRDVVADYAANRLTLAAEGRAPVFFGRTQAYKTYGAAVLARVLSERDTIDTHWVSVPEQFPLWELETFELKRAMLERWKRVPVLILDDILFCRPQTTEHKLLETLLASRFEQLRPTILTGNLVISADPWADLADRFGPLIGRRIQETARDFTALIP